MADTGSKLWAIIRREYVERVRTRWFIFSTLFAPLIFAGFVFLPLLLMTRDAKSVTPRVLILDATQQGLGTLVARSMAAMQGTQEEASTADVHVIQPDAIAASRDSATSEVARRLASGFIVLDSTTLRGDTVQYAGRKADSRSDRVALASAVRAGLAALHLKSNGVSNASVDSVISAPLPALHTEAINDAGRDTSTPAKAIVATFVAFFLYMTILLYGQSMLSGVIEEKMSRVSEIVISSVKPETLLAGKIVGVTAVGLTQQIVWIGGTIALISARAMLFGAPAVAKAQAAGAAAGAGGGFGSADMLAAVVATPWSWVIAVLLFLLLGILFYGSLYAAVGATVGSEQDARQAATPVIMLIVLTALLISPTVSNPNSQLALVTSLLPFSSPIIMPIRMALSDVPIIQVVGSLVILAASCLGAVWLAGRIYRVGLLMYGKRPSLAELRRWIFAS